MFLFYLLIFFSIFFTELRSFVGQIIQTEKLAILAVEQHKILLPPSYSRYLAWGFSDQSLRICNYDSEKAQAVFENLESSEILCACSPNSRTIITAGSSTVCLFGFLNFVIETLETVQDTLRYIRSLLCFAKKIVC